MRVLFYKKMYAAAFCRAVKNVAVRWRFTVFTMVSFHFLSSYYFLFGFVIFWHGPLIVSRGDGWGWPAASLACSNSIRGDEKIANDVELLEIFGL